MCPHLSFDFCAVDGWICVLEICDRSHTVWGPYSIFIQPIKHHHLQRRGQGGGGVWG